jgi:hypothetical protein
MTPNEPIAPATAGDQELDAILAVQLAVAWAGETVGAEGRLGWWRTELTDPEAGGDFLSRLLPRTHAWAAFGAVREAARRVDEAARRRCGTPDAMWSLFHFGFAWDERLDARLAELRQVGTPPREAMGAALAVWDRFDRATFTSWLEGLATKAATEVVPGGRKLRGRPASPVEAALKLAASLVPLGPAYPLPFFSMASP